MFRYPLVLSFSLLFAPVLRADDKAPRACAGAMDNYFENEVWAKVGATKCLTCHRKGGDAEESKFLLVDPRKSASTDEALRQNRASFARMAAVKEHDKSRMLQKVIGELDHGGKDVLKADSPEYRVL